jgi:hypothetical protein
MKKQLVAVAIAAAGICSTAQAQDGPPADPWGDATVTRAEDEAKAGERFAALDKNADGSLSAEEMAAAAPQGPGGGGRRGGSGGGMRRADADGDGKVSKEEFTTAQLRRFDMQDGNKDGQLTKAERDAARAEMMSRMREGGGFGGGNPGGGWGGGDNGGGGNWGGGSGE